MAVAIVGTLADGKKILSLMTRPLPPPLSLLSLPLEKDLFVASLN